MNIFTAIISFFKRFRYGAEINPTRDWVALLMLSAITLTGIVIWNMWAFDTVANGGIIGTAATSTPPVFDQASLDAVHAIFADRAAEEAKYETGVYNFSDPSQ